MQQLKEADIFSTDTQFTVMGVEAISNWKTKIATIFVFIGAVALSFGTFKEIWTPLSQIPFTTTLINSNNTIDPFVIRINYSSTQDIGKVKFYYLKQQLKIIDCPQKINSTTSQCFETPIINLLQGNISMTSFAQQSFMIYIQTFSLNHILNNKDQYQNYYLLFNRPNISTIVRLNTVQLSILNSIYNDDTKIITHPQIDSIISNIKPYDENPQQQLFDIQQFISYNQNNITGILVIFCQSSSQTSIQYQIKRVSLLKVLLVFLTWIKTLSAIVGIIVIINIFTMKSHISYELYSSRYNQNLKISRWKSIKLWVYDTLCEIGFKNKLNKVQCLKQQKLLSRAYSQVNHKISLNNVYRVISSIQNNKKQQQRQQEEKLSSLKSFRRSCNTQKGLVLSDFQLPQQQQQKINLNYSFSQQIKYTPYSPLKTIFPNVNQSKSIIRTILEAINMNSLRIKLLSKRCDKSSIFSVVMTCIGLSIIIPTLIYLGGFSQTSSTNTSTRLFKQLSYEFSNETKMFIRIVPPDTTGDYYQMINNPSEQTVRLIIINQNNQILQEHKAEFNCTDNLQEQIIPNCYCISTPITIRNNMLNNINTRLGIIFNSPRLLLFSVQIRYINYLFKPDGIVKVLQKMNTILLSDQYKQIKLTILQKHTNDQIQNLHQLSGFNNGDYKSSRQNDRGFIISLDNQVKIFKTKDKFIFSYFKNMWSISYTFFTVLLTFVIFPYNNKIAKGSIVSKVKNKKQKEKTSHLRQSEIQIVKREIEEKIQMQKKVFSIESMMQILYSKFYELDIKTPFVKSNLG